MLVVQSQLLRLEKWQSARHQALAARPQQDLITRSMKHSSKTRKNPRKRPLGFLRGEIWMAPDFDAPMKLVEDDEGRMALVPDSSSSSPKNKARKSSRKRKRS